MSRAEKCIPRILKHEGGYVNHPSDPGGATNKGITIATFRRYVKPNGTIADLKALTEAQAVVVYKRQYWDRVLADMLPAGVDYAVADYAVNSGPSQAARDLQRVVGAVVDGKVGPNTIKATRALDADLVIKSLCQRRIRFMKSIRGGKSWSVFGRGWQRRVDEVLADSIKDAAEKTPVKEPQGFAAIIATIIALFRKG